MGGRNCRCYRDIVPCSHEIKGFQLICSIAGTKLTFKIGVTVSTWCLLRDHTTDNTRTDPGYLFLPDLIMTMDTVAGLGLIRGMMLPGLETTGGVSERLVTGRTGPVAPGRTRNICWCVQGASSFDKTLHCPCLQSWKCSMAKCAVTTMNIIYGIARARIMAVCTSLDGCGRETDIRTMRHLPFACSTATGRSVGYRGSNTAAGIR